MRSFFLTFAFALLSVCAFSQSAIYSRVKLNLKPNDMARLSSIGIDPQGDWKKDGYLITEISTDDIQKLAVNGFTYQVLIPNMAKWYADRNLHPEKDNERSQNNCTANSYPTPAHFVLGSMGGFLTLTEALAQLDSMRVHYPSLITAKQQIGSLTSIEGRPTYFVKISDNPDVDEAEPEVLYSALTHAREPMGMQQLIFYMWYLLENYATNPDIKNLVDNTEMYFVPVVNVDGYTYNQTTDPTGGGLWRKNRRNNGDGSYGVDLNRNYGYQWGYDNVGSSPTGSDETYRGTAAFSEPETQTMKWFCEHRHFVTAIDNHTYSDVLLYPWGYKSTANPDSVLYKTYCALMTTDNKYFYGTPYQGLGYNANGGSFDWFYGDVSTKPRIISWSPEAGDAADGFWPASARIVPIANSYVLQNLYVARFAGKYARLTDQSPKIISTQNGFIKFDIQRLGLDTANFTVSIQAISSNIASVGSAKSFPAMALLADLTDSISYTLNTPMNGGDQVVFLLTVNNGLYTTSDTIRKIYGTPVVLFTDNASTIANWTAGGWALTTAQYYSSPSSITDSPSGNYSNNQNKTITLTNAVNLTGPIFALLNFRAKWDIEKGYDYVQVKASTDNGATWTPLCGKYTVLGTSYQVAGSPLYDGTQSSWVLEEIDLSQFLGHNVKFAFTLKSDGGTVADGFYFDDFKVAIINQTTIGINEQTMTDGQLLSDPMPNPATGSVEFTYGGLKGNANLEVYNALGALVRTMPIDQTSGTIDLNIGNWQSGLYLFRLSGSGWSSAYRKLIKE